MKKYFFVFVFSFIGFYSFAQQGRECVYHVKFYKWEWDYFKYLGYDTIPKYSKETGEVIGDTILYKIDTLYRATGYLNLTMPFPLEKSFTDTSKQVVVTSCDGTKKFEVEEFTLTYTYYYSDQLHIKGSVAKVSTLKKLYKRISDLLEEREHMAKLTNTKPDPSLCLYIKIKRNGKDDWIFLSDAPVKPSN